MKKAIQSEIKVSPLSDGAAFPQKLKDSKGRFDVQPKREKAVFVILARNTDIDGLKESISMLEDTFNKRYNYPYVFLNDVDFTDEFKTTMKGLSPSEMKFGTIEKEHWGYPPWINVDKADKERNGMAERNIIYGGSLSYRHMCRFNSGFFFRNKLLEEYDYYWRVEPNVKFYCDIEYDVFEFMRKNSYEYGWTISLPEYKETIPTLWETTLKFIKENPGLIAPVENSMSRIIDDFDGKYNSCHYWSNFEIGSLNFFRSEKYLKYFEYLDQAGGFFYERWGDAPVHSIAISMFLPQSKIHHFEDIGYYHGPFTNCPSKPSLAKKCKCDPKDTISHDDHCYKKFKELF